MHPPPHAAPHAAVAPLEGAERLVALDVLRGLALLGMILVHFHQRLERPVAGAEDLVGWAVWILVEQKAWGTFALLFGVGFAVLLRRLEARGDAVAPLYLRRLAVLAVFGLVAEVGFGFTILRIYAWWGVVLLLVRRWSTRALLALAALAACAGPVLAEALALHAWWTGAPPTPPADPALWRAAADAARHGSYATLLAARWALLVGSVFGRAWWALVPDSNLALFVLGLLAVRHRVLDEPARHARLIRGWMAFGALSWSVSWVVLHNLPELATPGLDWPVRFGLGLVQDQWLCLTYVGAVVLLLAYRPRWTARLAVFALAGRMALTNYMLQVAVLDALGSGYGLGLRLRPAAYVVATALLFGAEAALSRAWLARYRFGPLEWLWRSATYARWQPLRRAPAAALPAGAVAG